MHLEGPFQNRLSPALACLDISSIARGYVVLDAIVKRATVKVEFARAVSSGKFVTIFRGEIAAVLESYAIALEMAASELIDHVALTNPHDAIESALRNCVCERLGESVLIAEYRTVSSTLLGADLGLKACGLQLGSLKLADGIGGKGVCVLHGPLCDIEATVDVIRRGVREEHLVNIEMIANPHAEIGGFF